MQTPISQSTPFPELFTRERRRTRMRQFVQSFEQNGWKTFSPVAELMPVKLSNPRSTTSEWTAERAL